MISLHSMQAEMHMVRPDIMIYENINESNIKDISDYVKIWWLVWPIKGRRKNLKMIESSMMYPQNDRAFKMIFIALMVV